MADLTETEASAAAQPPAVPLRRNKGFRMLWIGQILSDTGSSAADLAYPLLILALTRSPVIAGGTGTAVQLTRFCLRLPAGALSDRLDRRLTMIVCDAGRAVLLGLLAILVTLHLVTWPIVLIVALADQGASVIFDPAAMAALPAIVADEQLEDAWAATEARSYAASLAGPALGGALFGLARAVPFLGDAVSYVVSAGTASRIRGRFRPDRTGPRKPLWREAIDGVQLVGRIPILRAVAIQAPLINFAFIGVVFGITLALRRDGTSAGVIGLVQAGIATGGLLGAVVAPRLQRRLRLSALVVAVTLGGAVMYVVTAFLIPSPLVAAPVALSFLLAPTANAALFSLMLRTTPEEMRGRVNNTVIMAASGLASLAPLTAGLLVEHLDDAWATGVFAATMAAAAVMAVVLPGVREADEALAGAQAVAAD